MSSYIKHLQELSTSKTFARKKDYIDYNLRDYFKEVGFKNLKLLEMGPGLGEFASYLNDKGITQLDLIDNDKRVIDYVKKEYKVKNGFLTNNISQIDNKLGSYNFIFLMQVLEHLPIGAYAEVVRILYKHLDDGGFLVIVVPNANNPLGLVERYGDLQHTGIFTEQSLKDLINLSGIKSFSIKIKSYEIPPFDPINIIRITLQKILHYLLLGLLIINGGVFFKTMTQNIMLIIRKDK